MNLDGKQTPLVVYPIGLFFTQPKLRWPQHSSKNSILDCQPNSLYTKPEAVPEPSGDFRLNSNKLTGYPGTRKKGGYNPTPGPPSLLFPLFGFWTPKCLGDRGACLCNRNLERYLGFCQCMWRKAYHWSRTAVVARLAFFAGRTAVEFKCMSLTNVLCMSPALMSSQRADVSILFYFRRAFIDTRCRQRAVIRWDSRDEQDQARVFFHFSFFHVTNYPRTTIAEIRPKRDFRGWTLDGHSISCFDRPLAQSGLTRLQCSLSFS